MCIGETRSPSHQCRLYFLVEHAQRSHSQKLQELQIFLEVANVREVNEVVVPKDTELTCSDVMRVPSGVSLTEVACFACEHQLSRHHLQQKVARREVITFTPSMTSHVVSTTVDVDQMRAVRDTLFIYLLRGIV